jgi:hypothetical protein
MIENMIEPFTQLQTMSIEQQCQWVVASTIPSLVFAAFLREFVVNRDVQLFARLFGAASVFTLVCFANYATQEVERAQEIVRKAKNVSEDHTATFLVAHQVKTQSGTVVEWSADGRSIGTVWSGGRCVRRGVDSNGSVDFVGSGKSDGVHAVPRGTHESTTSATTGTDATSDRIANAGRRF